MFRFGQINPVPLVPLGKRAEKEYRNIGTSIEGHLSVAAAFPSTATRKANLASTTCSQNFVASVRVLRDEIDDVRLLALRQPGGFRIASVVRRLNDGLHGIGIRQCRTNVRGDE